MSQIFLGIIVFIFVLILAMKYRFDGYPYRTPSPYRSTQDNRSIIGRFFKNLLEKLSERK